MNDKCIIWQTPAYHISTGAPFTSEIDSSRAGGKYIIDRDLKHQMPGGGDAGNRWRARLTTWLVDQRQLGNGCPEVTRDKIEAARKAKDMRVSKRADRILQFLAKKTGKPGTAVDVDSSPDSQTMSEASKTYLQMLAHSESVGESPKDRRDDLRFLLRYLKEGGMIESQSLHNRRFDLTLTVPGHDRVADLEHVVNATSDRVFVAMWFDKSRDAASESIKDAIEAAGYKAIRVDEQHYVGNIVDKIISEIRRSRFVVADFSQDDCARGGVYYEAGFARGLGLKVISTCKEADKGKLHFDILQDNHILWETEDDLRVRLEERISAVMGDGPRRGRESA